MKQKNKDSNTFLKGLPKNIFAGFVVSLIALPLGLGLAIASEAPPISGIIAAVVGGIIVSVLGGSNVTIAGPGNGLVIVVLGAITTLGAGDLYQGYLYTLAAIVMSGILILLLGFLKMGRLADFFPASAIEGMLAAIGLGILSKQFHIMIGHNNASGGILSLLVQIPEAIINLITTGTTSEKIAATIGVLSLLIMIFYSKIRNKYFQLIPAPMWILILTIGFSYVYVGLDIPYPMESRFLVNIPDDIFGSLAFPDFSIMYKSEFLMAVFALTFIASIESLLSIKAVDKLDPESRRSNVNRDLKALGLATTVSGLLGGLNVVTVIARSSVNVNNNATNRSANFFHSLFLVIFILVFQAQLKTIPLAALAAILVFTGYKLATPTTLLKISKIGKEQIFIFLTTLITTLLTNLMTGIGAGILITFIIHVVINRSLSLFISHIFKPNILMFKEPDGGNYYVSIKHFCSFINFYRLKNRLDAIPENENVILDFSMCSFVDHTSFEGVENYVQTFDKKGGSIELVGLDKHDTDSKHPFAIRKMIPSMALKPIENYFTKRQKNIKITAKEYKWNYVPKKNKDTHFLSDFVFFKTRKISYYYNNLFDKNNCKSVFDVEFTEGEFIAKEIVKTTIFHIKLDHKIPVFTLDKEGLLEMIYSLAGFKDITINNHPDFSKRFYLSGENEEEIKSIFTDELILFLESNPYYHIESNGCSIMIFKKERLLSVKEIKAMIYFGEQLYTFLK
ncbi:SulP family inorganic anion transporter [Cellulophaga baltica]|uniref:SulP family inorganic anion transporter n=1 Tax=Cellulophaga TaxID=104264 RepID=UPI001C06EF5E|nr:MULTISPECIES: SulP family inorganic anion transporter [Cellulophaga]MBU2995863.1 SulP family inorganic anion transporter [Cellulophaga baltica]MDO6767258.1 SulP family inorganic anion transporter [Cellulophaga sp. 1_MG-2023]